MRRITLFILLFFALSAAKSQTHLKESEIKDYELQIGQMIRYLQETVNFIGDPANSAHEKDIIFKESYAKIFKDENVQIEDDLDESRDVSINKDVQSYLKDIDFFFDNVIFTFDVQAISRIINDKGESSFKVSMVRTLSGQTIDGKNVSNSKKRFLEINLDSDKKELKIVSLYTTKPNVKDELYTWWNSMSRPWKDYFGKDRFITANVELSQVNLILENSYVKLTKQEMIVQDSFMIVDNDTITIDRIGELHGHRPDTIIFVNDTVYQWVNDTIEMDVSPIYEVLRQLTRITDVNVSENKSITDLDPLSELSDLRILNCSGTNVSNVNPIRNLNGIKELDISNTKITDISNLKYANIVQIFKADNNKIADVSIVEYFKNLNYLSLSNTDVSNISSLSECDNLQTLNLSGTLVNDLTPLCKLLQLSDLDVSNTYIGDLTSLQELKNLNSLNVEGTQVTNLNGIADLNELNEINFSNTKVADLEVLNDMPKLSIIYCDNSLVTREKADKFRDLNPSKLIINESEALTMWWNELPSFWKSLLVEQTNASMNPSKEELHSIINVKSLKLTHYIHDAGPISRMTNLEYLDLSDTKIDDLSPLSVLHNLETLNINNTAISDLSPLSNNNNLREIYIQGTNVKSLKPLHELENLTKIYAEGIDLSPTEVYELRKIQKQVTVIYQSDKLRLWWGNLNDTWRDIFAAHTLCNTNPTDEQLQAVVDIEELIIDPSYMVYTLEPLSQMSFIRKLVVNNNQIQDLSPLSDKYLLEILSVGGNPIDNILPLSNLLLLKELNMENTPVSDLNPMVNLKNIKTLNIGGTSVNSLRPLADLDSLEDLSIVNTDVKSIEPIMSLPSIRYLKAYNTKIKEKNIRLIKTMLPDLNVIYY